MSRWLSAVVLASVGLACSSVKPPPASLECELDEDCSEGTICDPFTARCVSGDQLPPRAHLSFDIRERSAGNTLFRAEVQGCDLEVQPGDDGFRALGVSRTDVLQILPLYVLNTSTPTDPNTPLADETITAEITLTQDGRVGLPPNPVERRVDQAFRVDDMISRLRVPWPRYHLFDQDRPPSHIVMRVRPESLGPLPAEGEPEPPPVEPASMWQMLAVPDTYVPLDDNDVPLPCTDNSDCCTPRGTCTPDVQDICILETGECTVPGGFEFSANATYDPGCDRATTGTVVSFDLDTGEVADPVVGANVRIRHADPSDELTPRLGVPGLISPPICSDDDACAEGQFCDVERERCVLALAGRSANDGVTTDEAGAFEGQLYTYCDPENDNYTREFSLTATPSAGQPTVNFRPQQVTYDPSPGIFLNPLCVPDWGEPVTVQVPLQGVPRDLASTATGIEYRCCDVGCLPAAETDAQTGPPAPLSACRGRTAAGATPTVRFEVPFIINEATYGNWLAAQCAELDIPTEDEEGPYQAGSLRSVANCPADGDACVAEGLAVGTDEEPRTYSVRIESPTGSVLGSRDLDVPISPSTLPVSPITLPQRVLVRGVVDVGESVCDDRADSTDCASRGALVIAERLAMPDETPTTVPGPYLHQVPTFFDLASGRSGAFVLPLDPGVWIMTALPAPGEDGGPAGFQILDLRSETIGDTMESGPIRFVLEEGILVTMDLASFDRTFVVPIDTGSFFDNPMMHPDGSGFVDLNQAGECLTPASEGAQGCKIRQLVPSGSNVSASQVGLVRFTARRSDAAVCAPGA